MEQYLFIFVFVFPKIISQCKFILFVFYLLFYYYLCITFLRPIQGLFNDLIYKVTKIVDQNVEDDSSMLGPIVF